MTAPGYVQRFARVPAALALLQHHPAGLPVHTLAGLLDAPPRSLLEELVAFFTADVPLDLAPYRGTALEFLGPAGDDVEPSHAERVRLVAEHPLADLGVDYLGADVLAPLHRAACELLAVEPDNTVLRAAIDRLESGVLAGVQGGEVYGGDVAARLRAAARARRRVRIRYARTWRPGVVDRVVDPYRVVCTRRGFELDAGPLDDARQIRTYLISGIHAAEVLEEEFERPADVEDRIAACRAETPVRVVVPPDRRWAVEMLSERSRLVGADEDSLAFAASVLPPVRERVGLLLVLAGPEAFVVEPADLADAGAQQARILLEQHGLA